MIFCSTVNLPREQSREFAECLQRRSGVNLIAARRKSEHGFAKQNDAFDRFGFSRDHAAQHGNYGCRKFNNNRRRGKSTVL